MKARKKERFHQLVHKVLVKQAQPDEQAELQSFITEHPELKQEFDQLGAEELALREILPLLEDIQHPRIGLPQPPVKRLQMEIREVFEPRRESQGELRELLAALEKSAGRRVGAERERLLELISAVHHSPSGGSERVSAQSPNLARLRKKVRETAGGAKGESGELEFLLNLLTGWVQRGESAEVRRRHFDLIAEIPLRIFERLMDKPSSDQGEVLQFRIGLKSHQARERWGEETLRRVVEAGGMSAHCDFGEQTQSGENRPDLVVRLPGDSFIIVDAKVPDFDFLSALESADEATRVKALAAHAAKLKATIKTLADRDYSAQFPNALDSVVLFLPAESLLSAALEGDRDLIVWAASKRVFLATPASLIAVLRLVGANWRRQDQFEKQQAVAEASQDLYTQVAKFFEHFSRIRPGLEGATSAFNDAIDIYSRMVRPSGERFFKLSAEACNRKLPKVKPVENALRLLVSGRK